MRLPQSPHTRLTIFGIVAGVFVGLFLLLTTPTRLQQPIARAPQPTVPETRTMTGWRIEKVPDPSVPNNFRYEIADHVRTYTVSVPIGGGTLEKDPPIWKGLISPFIDDADFVGALDFVDSIQDDTQRANALSFVVTQISRKPPPSYSHAPSFPDLAAPAPPDGPAPADPELGDTESAPEDEEAKEQNDIREFISTTRNEVARSLKLAQSIQDHGARAKALMNISVLQRSLGDIETAAETIQQAHVAFNDYQRAKNGFWRNVARACTTVLGWAGALGLGTFFTGLFVKVFGHYFVETVVHKVGDEKFAKALGTTLKTTAKESGLILPDSFKVDSE